MTTEISLKNAAILRPIKNCTPSFQLTNPGRRLQSVQLSHPPVVDVLAPAHGVRKMDFPIVTVVHIGKRRSNSALSHYGVRLSQKRLTDQSNFGSPSGRFNSRAKSRPTRTND
jgi:hypothetical protein